MSGLKTCGLFNRNKILLACEHKIILHCNIVITMRWAEAYTRNIVCWPFISVSDKIMNEKVISQVILRTEKTELLKLQVAHTRPHHLLLHLFFEYLFIFILNGKNITPFNVVPMKYWNYFEIVPKMVSNLRDEKGLECTRGSMISSLWNGRRKKYSILF